MPFTWTRWKPLGNNELVLALCREDRYGAKHLIANLRFRNRAIFNENLIAFNII